MGWEYRAMMRLTSRASLHVAVEREGSDIGERMQLVQAAWRRQRVLVQCKRVAFKIRRNLGILFDPDPGLMMWDVEDYLPRFVRFSAWDPFDEEYLSIYAFL